MVDEHATTYENPFKFSGKELDDITGLYDHGARSRDPKLTMWYGVDPLFEFYPDASPYVYCHNNPVRFVDPTGMFDTEAEATKYMHDSDIDGKVEQGEDGLFYVNDAQNQVSYFRDKSATGNTYGKEADGVVKCVLVTPEKSKIGGEANMFDYTSNGASVASGYPTIKGTWEYYNFKGDVRWIGKNGNYYKLSQVKNNGGYVRSMNYARNASRLTRGFGNGLTGLSMATSVVSTGIAVANGTDNTSTWTNAAIGIGGGVLTIVGAPAVVTGAAIVGVVWGVGQLLYGDEINGWIDNNFGYR